MTIQEAIQHAKAWLAVRKEVRALLVAHARYCTERVDIITTNRTKYQDEVFKLRRFPGDLSEQRLLDLIEKEPEK